MTPPGSSARGSAWGALRWPRAGIPERTLRSLDERWQFVALALITSFAAALRFRNLASYGLNLDEGFSVSLSSSTAHEFVTSIVAVEPNMTLYHILLRLWMQVGHSEFAVRSLSVILGAATVPVLFFLARRLFADAWLALTAALLLALHPYHLVLSQSARSYALVIFLVTLSGLFFVRGLQKPSWGIWLLYGLFSAAALYSHLFALLAIAAQIASLVFFPQRPPWKHVIFGVVSLAVFSAPLAVLLLYHRSAQQIAWVPPLNRAQVAVLLDSLTLSRSRSLTYIVSWLTAVLYTVGASRDEAWPYRFSVAWLFLPPVITVAVSNVRPLLVDRYLAVCIPAGVLLAASGLIILARWHCWVGAVLLAFTIFYSASNIRHYFHHPDYSENWREATAYVFSHARSGDEVVLMPFARPTFDYYRATYNRNVPDLRLSDSAADAPHSPLPQTVWFLGSVLLKPNWAEEAAAFGRARQGQYCAEPLPPNSGSVQIWEFSLCEPNARDTPHR